MSLFLCDRGEHTPPFVTHRSLIYHTFHEFLGLSYNCHEQISSTLFSSCKLKIQSISRSFNPTKIIQLSNSKNTTKMDILDFTRYLPSSPLPPPFPQHLLHPHLHHPRRPLPHPVPSPHQHPLPIHRPPKNDHQGLGRKRLPLHHPRRMGTKKPSNVSFATSITAFIASLRGQMMMMTTMSTPRVPPPRPVVHTPGRRRSNLRSVFGISLATLISNPYRTRFLLPTLGLSMGHKSA